MSCSGNSTSYALLYHLLISKKISALTYQTNKRGPNTDLCGTPEFTGTNVDSIHLNTTN